MGTGLTLLVLFIAILGFWAHPLKNEENGDISNVSTVNLCILLQTQTSSRFCKSFNKIMSCKAGLMLIVARSLLFVNSFLADQHSD